MAVSVSPGDKIPVRIDFPYKGMPQDCKVQFGLSTGTIVTGQISKRNINTEKGPYTIAEGSMDFANKTIDDVGIMVTIPATGFTAGVYNLYSIVRTLTDTTSEEGVAWAGIKIVS